MIRFIISKRGRRTGEFLRGLVLEELAESHPSSDEGIVCFGVPYNGSLPALNRKAGLLDKLEQLMVFTTEGVRRPKFWDIGTAMDNPDAIEYPVFGRRDRHKGGTDIVPILDRLDFEDRCLVGVDFMTKYIPSRAEYRIWIYRGRHLATYLKTLAYPEMYRWFGRSRRNGFAFEFVPRSLTSSESIEQAAKAVSTLGLDFGVVDIIEDQHGVPFVLEVNTAPGVEGPRHGILALARKIIKWERLGFPKRKGDQDA